VSATGQVNIVKLQLFQQLQAKGYVRARIDGDIYELDEPPALALRQKHTIEVVIDRFKVKTEDQDNLRIRLSESFENALNLANGLAVIASMNNDFPEQICSSQWACPECGYSLSELEPRLFSFNSPMGACARCDGLGIEPRNDDKPSQPCAQCQGNRLNSSAQNVFIQGRSITDIVNYSIESCHDFFQHLSLTGNRASIAEKIQKEIIARLSFLLNVGLDYLSLSRSAETLSGGEAQRIRLASQIGSGLVGVMYILDEPSIGLHQRDNERLLKTLFDLKGLSFPLLEIFKVLYSYY
jgi:excinuclease ABC subunit A